MKKIITAFIFCFLFGECFSQAGEWVWIKGDSVPNQPGNFGVQGVPSPTNNPPSLYEPCEWTDLNGNFWLFGGVHIGGGSVYGDLWKYDPLTNEWTWMKGSGILDDSGNYGLQGVSAPTNYPPARGYGVTTWADIQNNLWLFGGGGSNDFNDLWKYNIATNEWTWIKGPNLPNQIGIYGLQGISSSLNNPGSRGECAAAWTDNSGVLWFWGGDGFDSLGVFGPLNDLWKYNISTNQWTWMKGSPIAGQLGIYGTLGIEDTANTPGSRMVYSHWKDINGLLWLFGGLNDNGVGYFNDLWRFNYSTNNWTWMGGSNTAGVYGIKCITSLNNKPGERFENRAVYTDMNGNFWMFGGGTGLASQQVWNDLWKYCVVANKWEWISGDNYSNPNGHWGTNGISNPVNKPNGRAGAIGWNDHFGHLYLFGGTTTGFNLHNDLWKYTIDTTCGVCPNTTSIAENNLTNELLVFPNPSNSSLTISFSSSEKQIVELHIYNTLGKQIYFSKEEITKGKFEKEINVERMSDGIYFLQLKTKEGLISKKVMVQH